MLLERPDRQQAEALTIGNELGQLGPSHVFDQDNFVSRHYFDSTS
jgi:hypothetical protein